MKKIMYFIGLVSTLSIVFGCILHFFGNTIGDSVIVVASAVAIVCLFSIDALSKEEV